LRGRKDRFVLLKADRSLSYGTVVETLDLLNRMGIEGLGMVTDTSGTRPAGRR
jgi:biopolymer transport protein ExbD